MSFWSDPTLFSPAARRAAPPPAVPWAPVVIAEGAAKVEAAPDPEEERAQRHAAELDAAWAEGCEAGAARVRAELEAEVVEARRALAEAAAQLSATLAARSASLEADLAALAVGIAHALLGREVRDGQVVADLVRRALAEFPGDQAVRVRINPHDLSVIAAAPEGGAIPVAPGRDLTWVPDPELERGGVVVEGRERIVDGRVDLALERIYRALADG